MMEPRLIFIKNDESGYEFLNEEQLEYFFRVRNVDTDSITERKNITIGLERATLVSSLRQIPNQKVHKSLIFPDIQIPQCVSPSVQTVYIPPEPIKKTYITSQLIEFQEFDSPEVDKFEDDMSRYGQHKQHQADESQRLKVVESELDFRNKDKIFEEQKFFYTLLKLSGKKKKHMNPAELDIWAKRADFSDTEDNDEDLYSTEEEDRDVDIPEDHE